MTFSQLIFILKVMIFYYYIVRKNYYVKIIVELHIRNINKHLKFIEKSKQIIVFNQL